jgi:hypothetical protein
MITISPTRIRADASALVIYKGEPNRTVDWRLSGGGTLTPLTQTTDHNGQAAATYTPGTPWETIVVEVESGA